MKKKKMYEGEQDKIMNVKMTLETQVINLETAAQNAETYKVMNQGKEAMKNMRKDVDVDDVEDLVDGIREENEMAMGISDAIAGPIDPLLADDDDLLAELQQMEEEAEGEKVGELSFPAVPDDNLPEIAKSEADELKKLEAELAGV